MTSHHRLVCEVPLNVLCQSCGCFIASRAVLLQCLEHDPVQIAAYHLMQASRIRLSVLGHSHRGLSQAAYSNTYSRRVLLAYDPPLLIEAGLIQILLLKRRRTRKQLVKQHAQCVDITAGIDVQSAQLGLFRAHVQKCADDLKVLSVDRLVGQAGIDGFGYTEVNHLRYRPPIVQCHQYIAGLDIAVNDPFVMGVLYRTADLDK